MYYKVVKSISGKSSLVFNMSHLSKLKFFTCFGPLDFVLLVLFLKGINENEMKIFRMLFCYFFNPKLML